MYEILVEFSLNQSSNHPPISVQNTLQKKNPIILLDSNHLRQSYLRSLDSLNLRSDKECSMALRTGIWEGGIPWTTDPSEVDAVDQVDL
jgi:hypothetical protein